ncbi:hypothetical protein CQA66_05200 [Helicobacter aurati]|uniref:Uncharacterized protein n=1 Tax=Helicobacter aurati TaxID=137778 RepID=A0A3D8J504_9HELI|nr:hypothetical protein [Helicobacter aurati]RDU72276.1 hypothetical protein CQA66_05200 [Helicobacter aurati]
MVLQNNTFTAKTSNENTKANTENTKTNAIFMQQSTPTIESQNNTLHTSESSNKQTSNATHKSIFLFQKTQKQLERIANLSIFDEQILEKGLRFDSLDTGDSPFFKVYLGSTLYLACAYNHIVDERTFTKIQAPALHFIKCQEIQTINTEYLKICTPKINAFDYRVRSHGVDTRLFYEHPLKICPFCILAFCKILSKKYKKEISHTSVKQEEILNAIFQNTLKDIVL